MINPLPCLYSGLCWLLLFCSIIILFRRLLYLQAFVHVLYHPSYFTLSFCPSFASCVCCFAVCVCVCVCVCVFFFFFFFFGQAALLFFYRTKNERKKALALLVNLFSGVSTHLFICVRGIYCLIKAVPMSLRGLHPERVVGVRLCTLSPNVQMKQDQVHDVD
ncbi:hypothetical protein BC939DRAFT_20299 [Gamsiella multidivaricata]|uniref:uncharacterized protein n=1 Tax=Gamsiella multidivaricata TaxID=101098 RepID=UPI00222124AC|nr:uncharacterized protein BC939DRAFT_20299 [Gamsiella multidivaricata]KAI7816985.1 hypothetical protein BC939DRAFT_20299 [Gamsiella multidivaricata]